jgi:hypothetical protein
LSTDAVKALTAIAKDLLENEKVGGTWKHERNSVLEPTTPDLGAVLLRRPKT